MTHHSLRLDLAITGGTVLSCGGVGPRSATVAIHDRRVVALLDPGDTWDALRTIDASGSAVTPGFVEMVKAGIDCFNEHFDTYAVTPQVRTLGEVGLEATLGCDSLMAGSTQTHPYPAANTAHDPRKQPESPFSSPGISVGSASAEYMIAMKASAARSEVDRDASAP